MNTTVENRSSRSLKLSKKRQTPGCCCMPLMPQKPGPHLQRLIGNVTVIMAHGSKCHAIWMKTQMSLYWHCLFVATSMRTCISTLQRGESPKYQIYQNCTSILDRRSVTPL